MFRVAEIFIKTPLRSILPAAVNDHDPPFRCRLAGRPVQVQ